jgi:hypothetical protein
MRDPIFEQLEKECPYDMDTGDYWCMLRELYDGREPTVKITTNLFLHNDGNWIVADFEYVFHPKPTI